MATRTYFIIPDVSAVTLDVEPVTIGIASTVVKLKKSGGTVVDLGDSGDNPTGTVKNIAVGGSPALLSSVLVIVTSIDLVAVPEAQWDAVFNNLRINFHLGGGIDGDQNFNVDNDDKFRLPNKKFIIATKAIKFERHAT